MFPSFIIHGHAGSFLKSRADVQETNLVAGMKPGSPDWGIEPVEESGLLHIEKGDKIIYEKVKTLQGNYYDYYDTVYKALTSENAMPVTVDDGINVMRIIEIAIKSSKEGNVVKL